MENRTQNENTTISDVQVKQMLYPRLNRIDHAYWYRFIIVDGDSQLEIRYKLLVRFVQQQTDTSALLLIDRISDVYMNDELPSRSFDQLAYEAGKVFYPLIVEVDGRNKWLNICNYQQISSKWKSILPDIKRRFSGQEVDRYLKCMNDVIADKTKIKSTIENDLPMQFYFNTVYLGYTSMFETRAVIDFSVGDYAPIPFEVKHTLSESLNSRGYKEVYQQGFDLKKQSHLMSESGIEESENIYSATIQLDAQTNCIREVNAEWNFEFPQKRKIKLILYPLRQHPPNEVNYVIDDDCKPKKKGLLSILFGK